MEEQGPAIAGMRFERIGGTSERSFDRGARGPVSQTPTRLRLGLGLDWPFAIHHWRFLMHIAYIHQHFSTRKGFTGTRSYEMSRCLIDAGHRVSMICGSSEAA